MDEEFYYFIFIAEYLQNPDENSLPNENDKKYFDYSMLLLEALEFGLGYRIEWENALYLVPTPIVKIDNKNRFHSLTEPAIRWKNASEFYFIHGVKVDKKIVKEPESLIIEDWRNEKNLEVRRIIQERMGERFIKELNGKTVGKHKDERIGEVVEIDISPDPEKIAHYLKAKDWSTDRVYYLRVPPKINDPIEAQAWTYSDKNISLTKGDFEKIYAKVKRT